MTKRGKKYRNNLFLLTLAHLLLFVYPTVNKAIHMHEHDNTGRKITFSGLLSFNPSEKDCAVCNFQFVNFVTPGQPKTVACLPVPAVFQSPSPVESAVQLFLYILLRAPPVSNSIQVPETI